MRISVGISVILLSSLSTAAGPAFTVYNQNCAARAEAPTEKPAAGRLNFLFSRLRRP